MRIIIDDRENIAEDNLCKYIDSVAIFPYSISRITTGDIAIMSDDLTKTFVIIERKTLSDLASSLKDGRLHNTKKLLGLREKCGCSIIFIIEGNFLRKRKSKVSRMPFSNLMAYLDHLMIRDNIGIVWSDGPEYTAYRIFELAKHYDSIKHKPVIESFSVKETIEGEEVKKANLPSELTDTIRNDDKTLHEIWHAVYGVTAASVESAMTLSIKKLILGEYIEKDLAKITYSSGNPINAKQINKIIKISTMPNHVTKGKYNRGKKSISHHLLVSLPRVSDKAASLILSKYSLKQLITDEIELEKLEYPNGKKLGKAVMNSVNKWLNT